MSRTFRIELTRSAERELRALPRDVLRRVDRAIQGLRIEPRPNGCRKLQGSTSLFRIRVGDYRIVYELEDQAVLVLVIRVRHRREAYAP